MKLLASIVIVLSLTMYSCQEQDTQVIICSSIHGLHKSNSNYSYDDLFNYIENFDPEIVGVEIRQEDVDSTISYLKNYYPFEMYETAKRNSMKTVYGFDWLGTSIEGKPIYNNYFKKLDILKLQKQSGTDSIFQESLSELNKLAALKNEIASSSTIIELNDGSYDSLNALYYQKLDSLYSNTPYSKVAEFYRIRDNHISERINDIVSSHKGKRIIFILGADHRSNAVKTFHEKFDSDSSVKLLDISYIRNI